MIPDQDRAEEADASLLFSSANASAVCTVTSREVPGYSSRSAGICRLAIFFHGHIRYRRGGVRRFGEVDAVGLHELRVADEDAATREGRDETLARDIDRVRNEGSVNFRARHLRRVRVADRLRDRVGAHALGEGGHAEKLGLFDARSRQDLGHLEVAFGQGTGLIRHDGMEVREQLEVVRALHEHAVRAGRADAAEEGERNGDHEGTRAGHDEEGTCTVDPGRRIAGEDRRDDREGDRGVHDDRGVDAGEAGDEILGLRLLLGGVLDELEDLRDCGIFEGLGRPDAEESLTVDAAGDDRLTRMNAPRNGLAGERCGVHHGLTAQDLGIDRDLLARLDHEDVTDLDVVRIHRLDGPVRALNIGLLRNDVHETRDVLAGLSEGVLLEPLTDEVEGHDGDGLRILTGREGTDRRHEHEERLVHRLAVPDAEERLANHVIAAQEVRNQVREQAREAVREDQRAEARLIHHHHGEENREGGENFLQFLL